MSILKGAAALVASGATVLAVAGPAAAAFTATAPAYSSNGLTHAQYVSRLGGANQYDEKVLAMYPTRTATSLHVTVKVARLDPYWRTTRTAQRYMGLNVTFTSAGASPASVTVQGQMNIRGQYALTLSQCGIDGNSATGVSASTTRLHQEVTINVPFSTLRACQVPRGTLSEVADTNLTVYDAGLQASGDMEAGGRVKGLY